MIVNNNKGRNLCEPTKKHTSVIRESYCEGFWISAKPKGDKDKELLNLLISAATVVLEDQQVCVFSFAFIVVAFPKPDVETLLL